MSGFFVAVQRLVRRWHIHRQSVHHREGATVYTHCRCGRKGWYPLPGGYSPLDRKWLDAPNAGVRRTWAKFRDGEMLEPEHVVKLAEKALKPYREPTARPVTSKRPPRRASQRPSHATACRDDRCPHCE
jgi:hypothetical protein